MSEEDKNYLILIEEAKNALEQKDSIIERLADALEKKNENAAIGEAIQSAGKWFTVVEAAKELNIEIPGRKRKHVGQNQLYALLRNLELVMRKSDRSGDPPWWKYHQPYQTEVDAGRMKLEERRSYNQEGKIIRTTLISATGLIYIQKKINQVIEEGALDDLLS